MKIPGIIGLILLNIFAFWIVFPIEILIGIIVLTIHLINKHTSKTQEP